MAGGLQDRGRLRGIAATLLGLALLADRAAARSFPIRFLVLAILGRAEAIARTYVVREIEGRRWRLDLSCLDEPLGMHFGMLDAGLLALRLRMIAAVLGALADADARCAGEEGLSGGAPDLPLLLIVRLPRLPRAYWLRGRQGLRLAFAAPP